MNKAPKTYYIHTFGCQANKSDSERIAGDYQARGYLEADDWKSADEIVVNTCAVRKRAEDRAVGFLLNVVEYFKQQQLPKPKIILTGCMTHHGNQKIYEMLPMLDEILPINEVGFNQAAIRKDAPDINGLKHAWVPISAGCNSFCTFCIVPYSRGREQSRSLESIMDEVNRLVEQGYTEITLLGQNVNSWGLEKVGVSLRKRMLETETFSLKDVPSNSSQYQKPNGTPPFVQLLQAISALPQITTLRFISANPWDFHDELIEEIGKNKKIDRFIHLPVQSGSNSMLKRMNRGYTRENYLELIRKLKATDPDIVFGTDIIVGFPGETEAEFQDTLDLAKQVGYKAGFVAQYSPRPGTTAWKLYKDDISAQVKKQRWEILDQLINKDNLTIRPKIV